MFTVLLSTWGHALATLMNRKAWPSPRKPRRAPLMLETLEARVVPTDLLIATSFFDSAVYEFDAATGALQATLVAPYSSSLLLGPAGVTIGPDGNLYISSQDLTGQNNDAILQYDLNTGALSTFIPSSVLEPIATAAGDPTFAPSGLRFGPDGNLYVSLNGGQSATGGGEVVEFGIISGTGGLAYDGTFSAVATGLVQPAGLTFGTAPGDTDNLYVSNSGFQDVVKIIGATTPTPTSSTFVAPGSGGLNFPAGLTWGPDGNLYVVDLGATSFQGNVLQYNSDGSFSQVFTPTDPADPGNLLFQFPSDALFDAQGHQVTANLGPAYPPNLAGSINQYNSDGSFNQTLVSSSQFPDMGMGTSGISPSQLALLSSAPAPLGRAAGHGTLNPGGTATPGVLTVGSFTFNPGSTFAVALNGATAGTGYSQLVSAGTVNLNNATVIFTTTAPDPGIVLPPIYTFQSSDAGTATFPGAVVLFTPGDPTLTVTGLDSGITVTIV